MSRGKRCASRRGATIIEVVIALVILALAGAGMVSLLGQTLMSVHDVRIRERDVDRAEQQLAKVTTWPREMLDAHRGDSRFGIWRLQVVERGRTLYDVSLRDTLFGVELLHSTFYRPDTSYAP